MSLELIKFDSAISEKNIIKCGKLNNDIIFMKYDISLEDIIEVSENEFIMLVKNGQVYDYKEGPDKYNVSNSNKEIEEELKNLYIRDAKSNELCIIFLNKNIIKNSKLSIEHFKIKNIYLENKPITKIVNIDIVYDFRIEDFKKFLSKLVGLRNLFTKQEIIEKIRKNIADSIEKRIIKEIDEYKLDIDSLKNINKKIEDFNEYDVKLSEYGVKLINYEIIKYEEIDKKFKFF